MLEFVQPLVGFLVGLINFDLVAQEWRDYGQNVVQFAELWSTYGVHTCLLCMATFSAASILSMSPKDNRLYWLHSLVLVIFKAFTGGSLATMFVGKLPVLMTDDFVILFSICTWYTLHYTALSDLLLLAPVRAMWTTLAQLFRTSAICNATKLAAATIKTTRSFYEIPFFGPIVVGTTVAALGPFIPLDQGLKCISKEVPAVIQGAIFSSSFFHFMVNDQAGFVGRFVRTVVGDWTERYVRALIALLWIVDAAGELLECPQWRPFAVLWGVIGDSVCMPEVRWGVGEALSLLRVPCPCPDCPCCDVEKVESRVAPAASLAAAGQKNLCSYAYWLGVLYLRFMLVVSVLVALRGAIIA